MEHIGTLSLQYDRHDEGGVAYYNVEASVGDQERHFQMPRHHTSLGWIELFGLPPQNEWAIADPIADGIEPFRSEAKVTIDGSEYHEQLTFHHGLNGLLRYIGLERSGNERSETFHYTEDARNAPSAIHGQGSFIHSDGEYHYGVIKQVGDTADKVDASDEQRQFINDCMQQHGQPSVIIRKTFSAGGKLPPIYASMLPAHELLDLSKVEGTVLELGYLNTQGSQLAKAHGDWHKLYCANEQRFYIEEDSFSSRVVETPSGRQEVKDTYRKQLYRYE
jgi:hypothetical protein